MDIITKSHFTDFKNQYGYENKADSEAFELFCIYCIASRYVKQESITNDILEDINIGNGGDWGIDGLIILVNGQVVFNKEIVDDLLKVNGSLSVQLVFIQAKTSSSFKVAELGQTLEGAQNILREVRDEICDNLLPKCNEELKKYREIIKYLYSKCAYFRDGINPKIYIYYLSSG